MKTLALLLFLCLFLWAWPPASTSALAATQPICRQTATHQVCILDLRRSAKNYWEYRAVVSVDGVARPLEVYNCRSQMRIQQDGEKLPFQVDGAGAVICKLFK